METPRNGGTLTRIGLREAVYACCLGMSRAEARTILDSVLDEICEALVQGEPVNLRGFGKFHVRAKRARAGRNPRTGVDVTITPRRVVIFRPSSCLMARINDAARASADVGSIPQRVPSMQAEGR